MLKLLKVFGRGILVTVLLPFILVVWVGYATFCIFLFIFMFVKGVIEFFQGKSSSPDLPEDLEARRILLEQEKAQDHATQMLNVMYQNSLNQAQQADQQSFNPLDPFETGEEGFIEEKEDEDDDD